MYWVLRQNRVPIPDRVPIPKSSSDVLNGDSSPINISFLLALFVLEFQSICRILILIY